MTIRKAFVTGATGHLGSMLCRALVGRGVETVALVRSNSNRRALDGVDVRSVEGDVLDAKSLTSHARGCDVVFHNAAVFELHARDPNALNRVAVEGTQNAIATGAQIGARVVMTSSVATVGCSEGPDDLLDEQRWTGIPTVPYYRAKLESERRALDLAAELGADVVRVLPTVVLGPGDHRITPSSRLLVDMLHGTGMTFEGGLNVIDVRDVAAAMISAAERGRSGGRYILGGDNVLMRELGAIVARLTGRAVRHIGLPHWAMSMVAAGVELLAAASRAEPPVTRALVRDVYRRYAWYDVTRARTELGLTTRPLATTLEDAARFFHALDIAPARRMSVSRLA